MKRCSIAKSAGRRHKYEEQITGQQYPNQPAISRAMIGRLWYFSEPEIQPLSRLKNRLEPARILFFAILSLFSRSIHINQHIPDFSHELFNPYRPALHRRGGCRCCAGAAIPQMASKKLCRKAVEKYPGEQIFIGYFGIRMPARCMFAFGPCACFSVGALVGWGLGPDGTGSCAGWRALARRAVLLARGPGRTMAAGRARVCILLSG